MVDLEELVRKIRDFEVATGARITGLDVGSGALDDYEDNQMVGPIDLSITPKKDTP